MKKSQRNRRVKRRGTRKGNNKKTKRRNNKHFNKTLNWGGNDQSTKSIVLNIFNESFNSSSIDKEGCTNMYECLLNELNKDITTDTNIQNKICEIFEVIIEDYVKIYNSLSTTKIDKDFILKNKSVPYIETNDTDFIINENKNTTTLITYNNNQINKTYLFTRISTLINNYLFIVNKTAENKCNLIFNNLDKPRMQTIKNCLDYINTWIKASTQQ